MPILTDKSGRKWSIELTVGDLQRVQQQTGVNVVMQCCDLAKDPLQLSTVLWAIVEPEAVKRGIAAEEFFSGLAPDGQVGDFLDEAATAIVQCAANFYPTASMTAIKTAYEANRRIVGKMLEKMSGAITPEYEAMIENKVQEELSRVTGIFGNASTVSQAASA